MVSWKRFRVEKRILTRFIAATSEGSIPMAEGEELHVIELDQGDGWTRVRRIMHGSAVEEGFVPTSYIESTLYA
jgi:formin-binding protein 1